MRVVKECLWYNGETSCYELMDFDPNGLGKQEIAAKARAWLAARYGFNQEELGLVMDTIYLLDVETLEKVR